MKTSIINIKTDPATKEQAHKIISKLGLNFSSVLNACLRQIIVDKGVRFSTEPEEIPSKWLEKSLARAEKDKKEGYVSPTFDNVEDSIKWLMDPKAKYINGKIK